jgi:AraC-like DNA-binding protein
MLTWLEYAPPPELAGAVRSFWTLRGDGTSAQPRAMLVGEIRRPTLVHATANADVIGVSFHVGGAAEFFALPMRELCDQIVPLEELFPAGVIPSEVEGPVWAARQGSLIEPHPHRFLATLGMTLSKLRRRPQNALAKAAVRIIRARRGNVRVRELSALLGPSDRTIARSFDDCVGMSPKVFARLMRFHALLANPDRDAGYVDDSHLIHDFREFSGTTPAQFRQEQNAIGEAFIRD